MIYHAVPLAHPLTVGAGDYSVHPATDVGREDGFTFHSSLAYCSSQQSGR